jgi:hypothetical protein
MDDSTRRARTSLSAMLLTLGTFAFVVSLSLPGVTKTHDDRTIHVDGWTCAISYAPTGANNVFLASAFIVWGCAVWFRCVWARWIGLLMSAVTVALFALIGAVPGFEGIQRLRTGYWVWLASSIAVFAAFALLPGPVRPPPGESLPREDVDLGRSRLGAIFGGAATVILLVAHFLVPSIVGCEVKHGDAPSDQTGEYETGPFHSSGRSARIVTRPDGSKREVKEHSLHVLGPVALRQFGELKSGVHEFAALWLPLLFVAAIATRRRVWRWTGCALAASVALAALTLVDTPWSCSSFGLAPLELVWWGTPLLFLVAFALLPPRRSG